jgi:hypothetical protein
VRKTMYHVVLHASASGTISKNAEGRPTRI